jgi:MYXO-CTERM domain-containing protein
VQQGGFTQVKKVVLGFALSALAQICYGGTCTSGTLSSYIALGSGGCTIGVDELSNFQTLAGETDATAIDTAGINVTPSGGSFAPSLGFASSQTASANSLLEAIFTYTISGPSYYSASLALTNSSETVDGAVTDIENFCAGGGFGPDGVSGCTGSAGSLVALDGFQNTDGSGLGPVLSINVTNDFTLDGGTAGSASGGTFTDSFAATPEPSNLLLGMLGLALAAGARLRRSGFRVLHSVSTQPGEKK